MGGGTGRQGTLRPPQGLSPRGRGNQPAGVVRANGQSPGLSPRGRGNLSQTVPWRSAQCRGGSIPAWAGEPSSGPPELDRRYGGLSPRGRGNQGSLHCRAPVSQPRGLSPRGRGNQQGGSAITIPGCRMPSRWVYPRVGGGTRALWTPAARSCGGTPISPIPTRLEYRRSQL